MSRRASIIVATVMGTAFLAPVLAQQSPQPATDDAPQVFEVVAKRYAFEPAKIEVTEGDRVRLIVKSGDGVHGVEIKKYRVSKIVPRGGDEVTIEFVASTPGSFDILCSEYCGEGHEEMKGTLVVQARPKGRSK